MNIIAILLLALSFADYNGVFAEKKIFCNFNSWANYRQGNGKFLVEDIDPDLCTHIVYQYAKLGYESIIEPYDSYLDLRENWGLAAYERTVALKQKNANLKVLISIGGINESSKKYSEMAKKASKRAKFIQSVLDFCDMYKFDGLEISWEYPGSRYGEPQDKQNFVLLLKELRTAFDEKNLILTAAVSAGKVTIDAAYDIPAVSQYVDFLNLMTYDFHGSWEDITGINAPLNANAASGNGSEIHTVKYAVDYWLKNGAAAEKIILGLASYGRSFILKSASKNSVGSRSLAGGSRGPLTNEKGFLGYNEICLYLQKDGWTEVWDEVSSVPYAYYHKEWVGYDNIKSIDIKLQYLIDNNLGGAHLQSLDSDDFRGTCTDVKYPILVSIYDKLMN